MSYNDNTAQPVPGHVAIIMDGNGRWAQSRGLPRVAGHRKGASVVREIVEASMRVGVETLTLFSFSSENWKRPATEVNELMSLLKRYLKSEMAELNSKDIRFRVIGDRSRIARDIVRLIEEGEEMTSSNRSLTLNLAISYGGRSDIVDAARRIAKSAKLNLLDPDVIDDDTFRAYLLSASVPDVDLLIRTSGEKRISNFLLWQLAYAEMVFVDRYWPEFSEEDYLQALGEYGRRDRRYGATRDSL